MYFYTHTRSNMYLLLTHTHKQHIHLHECMHTPPHPNIWMHKHTKCPTILMQTLIHSHTQTHPLVSQLRHFAWLLPGFVTTMPCVSQSACQALLCLIQSGPIRGKVAGEWLLPAALICSSADTFQSRRSIHPSSIRPQLSLNHQGFFLTGKRLRNNDVLSKATRRC